VNVTLVRQKVRALAGSKGVDADTMREIGKILEGSDDWDLHRINPLGFAKAHGLDPALTVEAFVHGAKAGLFDFEWMLLCPVCGAVIRGEESIGAINRERYHCATCDVDTVTDLDDFVEVAFSVAPTVKKLRIAPFSSQDSYFRYFYSGHHTMPPEFEEYRRTRGFRGFAFIEGGEAGTMATTTEPNGLYRVVNPDGNALLRLTTGAAKSADPLIVDVDLADAGFEPADLRVPWGQTTVRIRNRRSRMAGVMMNFIDLPAIMAIIGREPPRDEPFLTGKMLLGNQSFRDLFRIQDLPLDLKLKVSHVTVLFTDLKGSTELYDRTGDVAAYNLVHEHFGVLREATRARGGAVVKTIGDAVMAVFPSPLEALRAARDMLQGIRAMNAQPGRRQMALKIGFHAGTALVVTANETMDYFGQTVNIAARVQGLADGGELWTTGQVIRTPSFRKALEDEGFAFERRSAVLKGVRKPVTVYKCVGC